MSNLRVVHPENLFVEHDNFKDPDNEFVKSFQNFMNITIETKSEVLFTNYLSGAFWSHPPWSDLHSDDILDAQTRRSLQTQILPFYSRYINDNNDTSKLDPSDSDPNLSFFDEISIEETKRLITSTKKIEHSFFLSADKVNYKFSYNGKKLNIKSISSANEIDDQVEINAHYRGYLKKQKADILAFKRDENLIIPDKINYDLLNGLSNEVKSKFKQIRPKTMGQALRIDGITPAAAYILLSHVKRKSIKQIA